MYFASYYHTQQYKENILSALVSFWKIKTIMTFLNKSDNEVNEKLSMGECIHKGTIYPPTEMLSPSWSNAKTSLIFFKIFHWIHLHVLLNLSCTEFFWHLINIKTSIQDQGRRKQRGWAMQWDLYLLSNKFLKWKVVLMYVFPYESERLLNSRLHHLHNINISAPIIIFAHSQMNIWHISPNLMTNISK